MEQRFFPSAARRGCPNRTLYAFTLVEMLVSTGVLVLLLILISQLFSAAMAVTGARSKQMDADAQARAVFGRMAVDFAQMVKRPDVDYYLKTSAADQYLNTNPQSAGTAQSGSNDQLAFYSQVPGYYPGSTGQSPVSLVAWRINTNSSSANYCQLQRLGDGLLWNTVGSSGSSAVVFSSGTKGAACCGPQTAISMNWPDATNSSADSNYEPAGPQVFRMEYYYVLKGQTSPAGTVFASELSDVPWEMRPDKNGLAYHTSVNGLQDVAAITVVIAVADPKTLALVNTTQLANLSGALVDFPATSSTGVNTTQSGSLQYLWQQTINTTNLVPRAAASSLRIYQRTFYLPSYPPSTH